MREFAEKIMDYRVHGVAGVGLFFAAVGVGLAAVGVQSLLWGAVYLGVVLAGVWGILTSFCAKCPCQAKRCSHIILGPMARLAPRRRPGPYTRGDVGGLIVSFLVILIFPQPWLWDKLWVGLVFWSAALAAAGDILVAVCPRCLNVRCPLNRRPAAG
ncbi:MAG: hypothetical protein C4524_08730 [Candidatus Zixiibacteriota bacterium]|nr:MAG: hypothetical protein C4524_08730 [candidate division Zixibacteria bacterium]